MAITSSSPGIPKLIKINVTSGIKGESINIRNRTNGDRIDATLGADAQAIVDLQNFANKYTAGHVIDFIVSGTVIGQNSLTTSGTDPQIVTIGTSTASTAARGI